MFRLSFLAIAAWLSLGLIIGWWLHGFYPAANLGMPDSPSRNATSGGKSDSDRLVLAEAAAKTEIETLIKEGDYELALSRLDSARTRNEQAVQQTQSAIISSLSKLGEESPEQTQKILQRLLEEDPYHPQALFLLGKTYFETNQAMNGLETLFDLKSFNQSEVREQDIDALIEKIENQYARELEETGNLSRLLHLYEYLTARDPQNLARFYKLADVQQKMQHYYDALASLNYVLYDLSWGKLAQTMVGEIQQLIDLDDEVQVPLQRSGEHFIVSANINGIDGARLLIDTGASLCVLRPQTAQQFGLPVDSDDYVTINQVAGVINAPRIEIDRLSLGDASANNIQASVIEMPPNIDSDGLLGMNFLNQFKFFIDQKREILYLGSR